jgi:predicted Zn-dependent protease
VSDYQSDFTNEILAQAISLKNEDKTEDAKQLLEAIVVAEPENVTAQRLIVELALESEELETAQDILSKAIPIAEEIGNSKELIRLNFFNAILAARQGDVNLSQSLIEQVESKAKATNDWLYLAYASEFRGVLYQHTQAFEQAEASFQQALDYHQVLQCPLGRSKGFMYLSELAQAQGDTDVAKAHAQQSLTITKQRQLKSYEPEVEAWLKKLNAL